MESVGNFRELRGHGKGRLIFSPWFSHRVTVFASVDGLFSEATENGTGKTNNVRFNNMIRIIEL